MSVSCPQSRRLGASMLAHCRNSDLRAGVERSRRCDGRKIDCEVAAHRLRDLGEVALGDPDETESKRRAPMKLAPNERQRLDQGLDRRVVRRPIMDAASKRGEAIARMRLNDGAPGDAADGRERLDA